MMKKESLDKLTIVGKEFKNLKVMCEELDIEYKDSTDCRKAIRKEVEQYVRFKDVGRKRCLIVEEVYDTKIEKIDGRGKQEGSRNAITVYAPHIDKLLLNDLASREEVSYTTINNIACMSGMTNDNHKIMLSDKGRFAEYLRLEYDITNSTAFRNSFYAINSLVRSTVKGCINRLDRQGYISYKEGHIVKVDTTLIDDCDKLPEEKEVDEYVRMADDELECILHIEKVVLEEFGVEKLRQLSDRKLSKYFKRVLELVQVEFPYINQLWKGYEITKLNIGKNNIISSEEVLNTKQTLSEIVLGKIKDKVEQDVIKVSHKLKQSDTTFGKAKTVQLEHYECQMLQDNYVRDIMIIINIMVKFSNPRVTQGELIQRIVEK